MKSNTKLSKRLMEIVEALPLKKGIRILEIGCGPGAMAREMSARVGDGYVLAIDRSAKAIQQAVSSSQAEIKTSKLSFRKCAIENFELEPGEKKFDLAVAVRVGALDGRHPEIENQSLKQIAKALTKKGLLYIDGVSVHPGPQELLLVVLGVYASSCFIAAVSGATSGIA